MWSVRCLPLALLAASLPLAGCESVDAAGADVSLADAGSGLDSAPSQPDAVLDAVQGGSDANQPIDSAPDDTAQAPLVGSGPLGAEGGFLSSTDGKASIAVPAGLLDAPLTFSIEAISDISGEATLVSGVYDFGPDNSKFALPLTLCLAIDEVAAQGDDTCLAFHNSDTGAWTCVDSPLYVPKPGFRCGLTTHFTPFAIARKPAKTADPLTFQLGTDKITVVLPGGGVLSVPAGTTSAPVDAWAAAVSAPVAEGSLASAIVELGPQGTTLQQPASLCLPVDPAVLSAKGGCLARLDSSTKPQQWVCVDPCLSKIGDSLACGQIHQLETFAILLGGAGSEAECAPKTSIGPEGGVATSKDGAALLQVPAKAVEKTLPFHVVAATSPVPVEVISGVVDIGPGGTQFATPATICLRQTPGTDSSNACLGYLDESVQPAKWKCEDQCLTQGGGDYLCGETTHLTSFAILLTGGGKGSGKCASDNDYILGKEGGIVLAPGGAAVVQFPAGAVDAPVSPLVSVVTAPPSPESLGSAAVDISLPDGKQPLVPVTVCLPATEAALQKGGCLAYVDESTGKPEWKCEDKCLKKASNNLLCGQTDHFTSFAILLGGAGSDTECAPKTSIGPEGGVATSKDGAALLQVPTKAVEKTLPFHVVAATSPVPVEVISGVVDIGPGGTQFATPATICLRQTPGTDSSNACLGYLDESVQPAKWKCEDQCLTQGGGDYLCGETTHLTSFAILLSGGGKGSGKCGSDNDYILGKEGGIVLAPGGVAVVQFPAGAVDAPVSPLVSVVTAPPSPESLGSAAVDISLPDGKQPLVPVTVCLPATEAALQKGGCLAYIDESSGKPEWKCEDKCLQKASSNLLCGQTDHFTSFAILLGGADDEKTCSMVSMPGYIDAAKGGSFEAAGGAVSLTIPAGALGSSTVFSVSESMLKTDPALSGVWDIGPEGLLFTSPATVCIKPSGVLSSYDGICLAYASADGQWSCEDACLSMDAGGRICGNTSHFSTWAIAKVSGSACK